MHNPGAMIKLRNEDVREKSEMVRDILSFVIFILIYTFLTQILHLCALDKALDCLSLNMDKDDEAVNLIPWMHDIRISQNIITAITEIPSHYELRTVLRLAIAIVLISIS